MDDTTLFWVFFLDCCKRVRRVFDMNVSMRVCGYAGGAQTSIQLESRRRVAQDICHLVLSALRNPDAADGAGVHENEGAAGTEIPRMAHGIVKVGGRHGAGVSVFLAQVAQRLDEVSPVLGLAGGCQVLYFHAQPWHSRTYLVWYLCCTVSMSTSVRPSWRGLTDALVRRLQHSMATILVLDGITALQARALSEALLAARQAGAVAIAIISLEGSMPPPQGLGDVSPSPMPGAGHSVATATPGGGLPAPLLECINSVELMLPELSLMEMRDLVAATLRTLSAGGCGAGGQGAASINKSVLVTCQDKVMDVLERLQHARAGTSGLPLYVCGVCLLALLRGASAVTGLPADVVLLWQEHILPALEERHGRLQVMWMLLALHYEPTGLLPSHVCNVEQMYASAAARPPAAGHLTGAAGMGHPKDFLSPDESICHVSASAEELVADMQGVLLGRSFSTGGHCVVLERVSLKQAVDKRYFEPWKRAEEEAAKPHVPGVNAKGIVAAMSIAPTRLLKKVTAVPPQPVEHQGIRARKGLKGVNALVQTRLKQLFANVVDAFTFLDQNGDECISTVELGHGFKRMGLTGLDMKQLGAAVAADGNVDIFEFMRLYAWEDIVHLDKALKLSRPHHREIVEQAMIKRKTLPDVEGPSKESPANFSAPAPTKKVSSSSSASAATHGVGKRAQGVRASGVGTTGVKDTVGHSLLADTDVRGGDDKADAVMITGIYLTLDSCILSLNNALEEEDTFFLGKIKLFIKSHSNCSVLTNSV